MTNAKLIIANADSNIRVYFIKKTRGKNGEHTAMIFPNSINGSIRSAYCKNVSDFTDGKEIREYDGVHHETDTIQRVITSELEEWPRITAAINIAERNQAIIGKDSFSDDYSLIVITYEVSVNDSVQQVHLVAKYRKTNIWYKKSVKYVFVGQTLKELTGDIFILNGCIDAIVSADDTYILMPRNFESIFNFYKKSEELIQNSEDDIKKWAFLDNSEKFINCIRGKKGAMLKMARVIRKSLSTLNSLDAASVKECLSQYEQFSDIEYNDEGKIVVTDRNRDLIIDILLSVYAKNLFTDELVRTKGA
jgi:hypothetical protein